MPTWNNAIWMMSDLQLRSVQEAQTVLGQTVNDMQGLGLPLDAIWCLGDVLQGADLAGLEATAVEVVNTFEQLGLPVWFLMGNHDMDLQRRHINRHPLYEAIQGRADWHSNPKLSDMHFTADWAGYRVHFLGDHAAEDGSWFTSHDKVAGNSALYPYGSEAFSCLKQQISDCGKPVLMASHYAFPGGPRWGQLHQALVPLPDNVRGAFFGHAHVGDPVWNPDAIWQRQFRIENQDITQYNISAVESIRSPGSHSAVLLAGSAGELELRVRCHLERDWVATFQL